MKNLKILMLGWGNKAYLHSGLGVACYNLCRALSKKVDISLIIPEIEPTFQVDRMNLINLNTSDPKTFDSVLQNTELRKSIEIEDPQQESVQNIIKIPVELMPYYSGELGTSLIHELNRILENRKSNRKNKDEGSSEDLSEPFAEGILDRVMDYARLVEEKSKHLDFDIIHAHDWMTFLAGIYVKNVSGKPLILHIHSLDYDRVGGKNRSWVFNIERYAMSRADFVITVSNYTAGIIFSKYGLSSNKVLAIHNGIEPEDVFRLPSETSRKTVLFVGRITEMKGPRYFLQIAKKVYGKYENVRFVMVGVGDELKQIAESDIFKELKDRIELKGFVEPEELKLIYSTTDVYCLPSVSEPFGLTALEATQFGIPVVLSSRSGVSEVLTSALTADFWDIDRMSTQIVALLKNKKLRQKQIEAGYMDIENSTWVKTANEIVKVYKKAVSG